MDIYDISEIVISSSKVRRIDADRIEANLTKISLSRITKNDEV